MRVPGHRVVGYHPPIIHNQASHFIHGLIAADFGHLRHDWLATTRSAFPAFDLIVALAHRWLLENVAGKLLLMAGAAWLMRDTVVRPVMVDFIVLVLGSVGLFEVTRFYPLAALEPWRGMVCVAPAASAIVLDRDLATPDARMAERGPWRALAAAGHSACSYGRPGSV